MLRNYRLPIKSLIVASSWSHLYLFQKKIVDKIKTHISFSLHFFFPKSCLLWDNVENYCTTRKVTDDSMAHAHCMLDTYVDKNILGIYYTYCFTTATMIARTPSMLRYTSIVYLVLKKQFLFSIVWSTILLIQLSLHLSFDAIFNITKGLFERLRAKMKVNLDHIVMKQWSAFLLRVRYWYFNIILSKYTDREFHVKYSYSANSWYSVVFGSLYRVRVD